MIRTQKTVTFTMLCLVALVGSPSALGQPEDLGKGLVLDGEVMAWGYNEFGQIGDGTTTERHTPVQVFGLTRAVGISAGRDHSVAMTSEGKVWAWGSNARGQVGDGTVTARHTPVQVSGLTGAAAISAGRDHSVVMTGEGRVWAWGGGSYGQLGDGTTTDRHAPVQVSGLSGVVSVAGGGYHSLAATADGRVWAWGSSSFGQLGDGTTTDRHTPVQVSSLSGVVGVAGGGYHSLAVTADGTVWAWGENFFGQLGDGTTTDRHAPVRVSGLSGVVSVAVGGDHSLAVKSDGTVWAWGANFFGQLGDGTTTFRTTPVQVSGLSGVVSVAGGANHSLGADHSLAVKSDGTVWAWGSNNHGQLGDGTEIDRYAPVEVLGVSDAAEVVAGGFHSLSLLGEVSTSSVATALDELKASAIARLNSDLDSLADALAYSFLVADGKAGAQAISELTSFAGTAEGAFGATTTFIFEGSGGGAADLGAGLLSDFLIDWSVGNVQEAQWEHFRHILSVFDELSGTSNFSTVRSAIRTRLEEDFVAGGSHVSFSAARQSIERDINNLKAWFAQNPPAASFPEDDVVLLIGLAAQSLRDTTGREGRLAFFDSDSFRYQMSLSGTSRLYAGAAKSLYMTDEHEQSVRFWRTVALGVAALSKGVFAIAIAAPSGGASIGAWVVTEKALAASLAVAQTISQVSYEAADLENNRLAAIQAMRALDSVLGEIGEIEGSVDEEGNVEGVFRRRSRSGAPLIAAVDGMVRDYASGNGRALDGYSLSVEGFTLPEAVYTLAHGFATVDGELTIRNTGSREAAPSPLLAVSSWTMNSYEKVGFGALEELPILAPGEVRTIPWRANVSAFSVVPSTVSLSLGFGPRLLNVGHGPEDVGQFLVIPDGAGDLGLHNNFTTVPVGTGEGQGSYTHQPGPTTKFVVYTLDFAFGDLDLHVYDDVNGWHQGLDYTTGKLDVNGIPLASGPNPEDNPEAIRVPVSPGVTYRVEVVDRAGGGKASSSANALAAMRFSKAANAENAANTFKVVAVEEGDLPAVLTVTPGEQTIHQDSGATQVTGELSIREIGLQAPITWITAECGDLVGLTGDVIPARDVSLDLGSSSLQPGEATSVRFTVPMSGRTDLPYAGDIVVSSSAGTRSAQITVATPQELAPGITDAGEHLYMIPASAHAGGVGGTNWVSDAVLLNQGNSAAVVHLYLLEGGGENSGEIGRVVTVPPGTSTRLDDLVLTLFGRGSAAGAVLIGSSEPLTISSRTFNNAQSGTYGQYLPGMPTASAVEMWGEARLIQLTRNGSYRTNIGVSNASGGALSVDVALHRANGSQIDVRRFELPPWGWSQVTDIFGTAVDDGYAVVSSDSAGARYFAYASVVDNRSGDPVAVMPPVSGSGPIYIPGGAALAGAAGTNWKTDLEVHNAGTTQASYSIALLKRDQPNSSPTTRSFDLAPGRSVRFANVLQSVFGYSGAATLRITPSSGQVVTSARAFNDQPGGTYGQFIAGLPESFALSSEQTGWLAQLSQSANNTSGYRSNLGLASASNFTVAVEATFFRGDGTLLGTKTYSLAPYESKQYDRVFRQVTANAVDNGFISLTTSTPGARLFVFASVVDNRSGDPVYIPASVTGAMSASYSISGNAGVAGANIEAGGRTVTADSSGNFAISGLPAGPYTVTPSKTGCTFSPVSRSVTLGPDVQGINFTASCGYSISGDAGVTGATIDAGGRTATADGSGNYTITGLTAGSKMVTPSKEGCTFSPASTTVTLPPNAQGVDFTASCGGGGQELTVMLPGGVPLVLVKIPAGTFVMGSPGSERGRESDEGPQHQVTLTKDFYIGKYEVTQRQWLAVMGNNPAGYASCGIDCPVETVSWYEVCGGSTGSDCVSSSFIGKVNQLLGTTKFRLPTEAEWEYSARGGTTTTFSFGTSSDWDLQCGGFPEATNYMWWCGNNGPSTHPVGTRQPNPYGLYDMHGNVWEYVADWHGSYSSTPIADPIGPTSGTYRVGRGASSSDYAQSCRSASRSVFRPGNSGTIVGFRLARTP